AGVIAEQTGFCPLCIEVVQPDSLDHFVPAWSQQMADNRFVTALSVEDGPTPRLYFTAHDKRLVAESEDLLRFKEPKPCADGEGEKKWVRFW
ncbi:MAG: hypothetical protein J6S44_01915, partial [Clostridia bacterium]|nr:hypothetical protein [Clostridia bacterium]